MELLKKNMLSIAMGVVALVAIVATFYPVQGWFEQQTTDLQKRAGVSRELSSLKDKERKLPIVDIYTREAERLERFPNDNVVEWGRKLTSQVKRQAMDIMKVAVDLNRRTYMNKARGSQYLALWELTGRKKPDDQSAWNFRQDYDNWMRVTPRQAAVPGALTPSFDPQAAGLLLQYLKAVMPPTQEEILKAVNDRAAFWKAQLQFVGNVPVNQAQVNAAFDKEALLIPQALKTKAATEGMIYINGDQTVSYHPKIRESLAGQAPSVHDMWFAQVGLWIHQDTAKAIVACNEKVGAKDVRSAVVKRLLSINVPPEYFGPSGAITTAGIFAHLMPGAAPPPAVAPAAPTGPLFIRSATGRVSQPFYDVVVYKISAHVDARRVEMLVAELSRNRLVTVLNLESMVSVNLADVEKLGFIYGDAPVVEVVIQCEALFMREWTKDLMPDIIRTLLQIPTSVAAAN